MYETWKVKPNKIQKTKKKVNSIIRTQWGIVKITYPNK